HFYIISSPIEDISMNSAVLSTSTVAVARVATSSKNARNVAVKAEVRKRVRLASLVARMLSI
ncbi:MAG: hypothetical protein ABGY24_16075, partial [bacterium]